MGIDYSHSHGEAQATLTESVGETGGKKEVNDSQRNLGIRKEGVQWRNNRLTPSKKWREHRLVKDNRHLRNLIFAGEVGLN